MRSSSGTVSGIYFESSGDESAPAILFAHPLGSDLTIWKRHATELCNSYRVVHFDTRGHGRSAVPEQPLSIADLGGDVIRLLDHLSIARVHFCGASLGGMTGQWLGIHSPERLHTLTLADTAPQMGSVEMWDERIANVERNGLASISPATMERWFTAAFREAQPEVVGHLKQVLETTPLAGYVACARVVQTGILPGESYERLDSMQVPVLVVTGTEDSAAPPEKVRLLSARIPRSKYLELPAAHLAPVEAADAFLAAFRELLRR